MNVADWLRNLGLERYEAAFRDNEINEQILPSLTQEDLKEIGVGPVGHRRMLLGAIAALRAGTDGNSSAADAATTTSTQKVSPEDRAERRHVTVMFSDLVGSTVLSARMDPEDLREVISAYQNSVAETVGRFGGFVAKYMGDGVLVYFGYPRAHEDDAERAVSAGLELVAAVSSLKTHAALQTRVGIATGLVVVGDLIGSGASQEQAIIGDTPNLAARLQAIAEPDSVVIAESTRRLVGNLFELEDLGPQELKGISGPIRAWAAQRPASVEGRFDAMHTSGLTDLVGREEELDLLLRRWSRAKSGDGQVVLLSGEAGIGKSRLTAALLERLATEPHTRLRYFCSPQHTDSAFYPIVSRMERAAGLAHEDTPQAKLDKLDALLAQSSTLPQDAALFAEMLSLPNDGRYPALELTPQQRRQRILDALAMQIEVLARRSPTLMIFEDAHWADPTSLEMFGRAVMDRISALSVMLIVTYRPEFQPPWIGQPHVTTLTLNRLGQSEIAAMIDAVTGNKPLLASINQDIVERTDGVPLFIEEMTKAVLETGGQEGAERAIASIPAPSIAIPASLHASLMARLDRLGSAKEIAQIGAVIGREFAYELLALIGERSEAELKGGLERLTRAGLLFARGSPPNAAYTFKHTLVQDAAYGTLLRSRRQGLHARIAKEIEIHFAEMGDQRPELLAHHATQAGLIERAVVQWGKAGRKSVSRSAMIEAVSQLRRGLELVPSLPDTPERQRLELELQSALGGALVASKGIAAPETGSAYARARLLCEQLGDSVSLIPVLSGQISHHFGRAEYALARRKAEDLLRLAQSRGDTASELVGSRSMGLNLHLLGEFRAAARSFERVLQIYDPNEHGALTAVAAYDMRALALTYLSVDLFILGHIDEALSRGEEGIAWSRQLNHPHTLSYALSFGALAYVLRGENEKAEAMTEEVLALAAAQNLPVWLPSANVFRGYLRVARGDTGALTFARQGIAAKNAQGSVLNQPFFLSLLAASCERAGRAEEALSLLAEAFAIAERTGERWFEAELYRLRGNWLLIHRSGMEAEAETCLHRALTLARQQAAVMWELRAAVSLARFWSGKARRKEAADLLVPLWDAFAQSSPIPDIEAARALLIELQ
jgi:predicted ATPase/class 3 adenylate cyclase